MITIYGIRNCDTIKKTVKWLQDEELEYEFHDYKKQGIDKKTLNRWCKQVDWQELVNKRGTTWRKLPETERDNLTKTSALQLMIDNPSLIKRPVIEHDNQTKIEVGFNKESIASALSV